MAPYINEQIICLPTSQVYSNTTAKLVGPGSTRPTPGYATASAIEHGFLVMYIPVSPVAAWENAKTTTKIDGNLHA